MGLKVIKGNFPYKISSSGNEPPNGGDMEKRVSEMEKAVVRIDATLPQVATKIDIMELKESISNLRSSLIQWFIGTAIALAMLSFAVARLLPAPPLKI